MTTTLLLIPSPQHASLLDGGPCGARCPKMRSATGDINGRFDSLRWFAPDRCGQWPDYIDYKDIALAIWHNGAPVLPGLWLLQAAILGEMSRQGVDVITAPLIVIIGDTYTEAEARDILALAESLGIGEGVILERP